MEKSDGWYFHLIYVLGHFDTQYIVDILVIYHDTFVFNDK